MPEVALRPRGAAALMRAGARSTASSIGFRALNPYNLMRM